MTCELSDLSDGQSTTFAMLLLPKKEDDVSGRASVQSDQSGTEFGDLESAQVFLERGDREAETQTGFEADLPFGEFNTGTNNDENNTGF